MSANSGASASIRRPRLVVFDLDGTLWYPEMYMLWGSGGAPFVKSPDGNVEDRSGTKVKLMGFTREILRTIDRETTKIGIASSTDEPTWADECMEKIILDTDGERKLKMADVIWKDAVAIQKGNKSGHFQLIHRNTKIPYDDMIFFDNEPRNIRAVQPLGVQCVLTPDGMTKENWEAALADFSRSK